MAFREPGGRAAPRGPSAPSSRRFREFLRELDEGAPDRIVGDLREGADEAHRLGLGQEIEQAGVARTLAALAALEKRADVQAEDRGELIQPRSAHPVRAVFVFLDLLEAHPELFTELGLRHL